MGWFEECSGLFFYFKSEWSSSISKEQIYYHAKTCQFNFFFWVQIVLTPRCSAMLLYLAGIWTKGQSWDPWGCVCIGEVIIVLYTPSVWWCSTSNLLFHHTFAPSLFLFFCALRYLCLCLYQIHRVLSITTNDTFLPCCISFFDSYYHTCVNLLKFVFIVIIKIITIDITIFLFLFWIYLISVHL